MITEEKPFDMVASDLEMSEICLRLYDKYGDEEWLRNSNECAERAQRSLKRESPLTTEQYERAKALLTANNRN